MCKYFTEGAPIHANASDSPDDGRVCTTIYKVCYILMIWLLRKDATNESH